MTSGFILKRPVLLFAVLLVSWTLSAADSLHKKRGSYLSYIEVLFGNNTNQGSIGMEYYDVNNTVTFGLHAHLYSYRCFSFLLGGSYLSKAYTGDQANLRRFNNFGRGSPYLTGRLYFKPIDFGMNYVSLDLKSRVTLLEKRRLQPFFTFGIRYNVLISYRYNTGNRFDELDDYIIPNIRKTYINYIYGIGVFYKFKRVNAGLLLSIELNNDNQLRKENQRYFTQWKYGKAKNMDPSLQAAYGGKFQSLLITLGYRHYF